MNSQKIGPAFFEVREDEGLLRITPGEGWQMFGNNSVPLLEARALLAKERKKPTSLQRAGAVLCLTGLVSVLGGLALFSLPLCLIVAGVAMLYIGWAAATT